MEEKSKNDLLVEIDSLKAQYKKLEKRFTNYMKIEEEMFDEYNNYKREHQQFIQDFRFILASKRTWFGKFIMWLMFKGNINEIHTMEEIERNLKKDSLKNELKEELKDEMKAEVKEEVKEELKKENPND